MIETLYSYGAWNTLLVVPMCLVSPNISPVMPTSPFMLSPSSDPINAQFLSLMENAIKPISEPIFPQYQ